MVLLLSEQTSSIKWKKAKLGLAWFMQDSAKPRIACVTLTNSEDFWNSQNEKDRRDLNLRKGIAQKGLCQAPKTLKNCDTAYAQCWLLMVATRPYFKPSQVPTLGLICGGQLSWMSRIHLISKVPADCRFVKSFLEAPAKKIFITNLMIGPWQSWLESTWFVVSRAAKGNVYANTLMSNKCGSFRCGNHLVETLKTMTKFLQSWKSMLYKNGAHIKNID